MGYKKRGFGKGNLLGIGGKVEEGETIEQAAIRELQEEIDIKPDTLTPRGILNFYFPHVEDESWNQQVHIFITTSWQGEPNESDEIKPQWFICNEIPYEKMWDDAKYWLPHILANKIIEANFFFNKELQVIDSSMSKL